MQGLCTSRISQAQSCDPAFHSGQKYLNKYTTLFLCPKIRHKFHFCAFKIALKIFFILSKSLYFYTSAWKCHKIIAWGYLERVWFKNMQMYVNFGSFRYLVDVIFMQFGSLCLPCVYCKYSVINVNNIHNSFGKLEVI